ncbi:type II toxin-antitoxin system PemK/MazF family toxin [Paraburkholderia sp. MPAMCS5]|uniref:type II toxin-antitoxin system PemK/MazF family toxin n=1 Tax=Paraburkholderia sp. MPAMCS5 TaxID=3112563 RepID=UPI002E178A8A|nr:type II toxin-antitoxin system PemK/MazF family toxin [Paraburkholderia sp. MPAMCS5]
MQNGIPETGDIVRLHVGPVKGNEQDGYRAVLVISDYVMNEITQKFTGLPITTTVRGWETEIALDSLERPGVALVDHIRSFSYIDRKLDYRGERASDAEVAAAKHAIREFLQL